jgi:hypothetical protein
MKHIKEFKELNEMLNLSKVRKWKTTKNGYSDFYFTYGLKKDELGKYLNTWFVGYQASKGDMIYTDEMITLKKVDDETARHLYNRKYNPVSITIMCPSGAKFKKDGNDNYLYEMKAQIRSIDDSSYGIWWYYYENSELPLSEMKDARNKLMEWVNSQPVLNGEEFLDMCVSLGASEGSKDYN